MFEKLINKLIKIQLQSCTINNNFDTKLKEENNFEIIVLKENNIYKIEISDYVHISEYIKKIESSYEYDILNLICNSVLWNNEKQKINKGIYYVINIANRLYNILFNDEIIIINERIKIELDEQTQKENITQERVITFYINKNDYQYYIAKHELNENTYYTRYYNKNRTYNLGVLELTKEETYDEINSVIYNLENIEEINNIIDIEILKNNILENLRQEHKYYKKI